jgi:nitric oxide reductase large subunit
LHDSARNDARRPLLVSKGWLQAVALVVLFGFFVLGLLAYRTYTEQPPIPERVVDPAGGTIFTRDDVMSGQEVFLRNGLMEYGSIFGHGAYLGPDQAAWRLAFDPLSADAAYTALSETRPHASIDSAGIRVLHDQRPERARRRHQDRGVACERLERGLETERSERVTDTLESRTHVS